MDQRNVEPQGDMGRSSVVIGTGGEQPRGSMGWLLNDSITKPGLQERWGGLGAYLA